MQHFASLTFVIQQFLKECVSETGLSAEELRPVACCLAVAGPVRANKATITNVDWKLDGAEMSKQLGIPDVLIINGQAEWPTQQRRRCKGLST